MIKEKSTYLGIALLAISCSVMADVSVPVYNKAGSTIIIAFMTAESAKNKDLAVPADAVTIAQDSQGSIKYVENGVLYVAVGSQKGKRLTLAHPSLQPTGITAEDKEADKETKTQLVIEYSDANNNETISLRNKAKKDSGSASKEKPASGSQQSSASSSSGGTKKQSSGRGASRGSRQ